MSALQALAHEATAAKGRAPAGAPPPRPPLRRARHGERLCLAELLVPPVGRFKPPVRFGPGQDAQAFYAAAGQLRRQLTVGMGTPRGNVLVYGHQDSATRHWQNAVSFACRAERAGLAVQLVHDFASLPWERQCRLFFDAGWVVSAHGGHMGNAICARPGTVLVELACKEFGWLGASPELWRSMAWDYRHQRPDACLWRDRNSHFWEELGRLGWVITAARNASRAAATAVTLGRSGAAGRAFVGANASSCVGTRALRRRCSGCTLLQAGLRLRAQQVQVCSSSGDDCRLQAARVLQNGAGFILEPGSLATSRRI